MGKTEISPTSRHRNARSDSSGTLGLLSGLGPGQAAVTLEEARLPGLGGAVRQEKWEWIAQDLHDGIIQSIYATGLGLEECLRLLDEDPPRARFKLTEAIDRLDVVIREARSYLIGLQPEILRDRGLSGALSDLVRGLELCGLRVAELEVEPGIDAMLGPAETTHLLHICREVLTNVVKHARGSRVRLTLARSNDVIRLRVKDDGVGFDPGCRPSGLGLRNIGDRVRYLGGTLSIDSARGHGTRITVDLPLQTVA